MAGTRVWSEKACVFGLHLTFTRYTVTKDELIFEHGLLSYTRKVIPLYRIGAVEIHRTLGDRFFGTGNVVVRSTERDMPEMVLSHIHKSNDVSDMILDLVQRSRRRNRVTATEILPDVY